MCNDFKAGGGKRFMDELAATANMDLAALAKWAKRPSPQKDSSKNDPLGGCLIVNRLAVHLQNTGRARCSEAQRIEDEKYLHPCAAPRWPPNYGERHALMAQGGRWRLGLLE